MKPLVILSLVLSLVQVASARAVRDPTIPELFELAPLAVTGEVLKIEPTGIETSLSYPTLDAIVFQWLRVTCNVGSVLKGKHTAATINVAMLAVRKSGAHAGMNNGPLILEPKVGTLYVMFLAPSSTLGLHASLFAPYDERNAILILDRKDREYDDTGSYMSPDYRKKWQEKKDLVWSLTSLVGGLSKSGAEAVIKQYKAQIARPGKAVTIPLEWKKHTEPSGWGWDVPKDVPLPASKTK
ncbi:MAG: hypothetical protein WCS99_16005 [Limisphaerales bacterium]